MLNFLIIKDLILLIAITLDSIKYAEKNLFDIMMFDTAGRQVVDEGNDDRAKNYCSKT